MSKGLAEIFFAAIVVYLLANGSPNDFFSIRNWSFSVAEDGQSIFVHAGSHNGQPEFMTNDTLNYVNNSSKQSNFINGTRQRGGVVFARKQWRNGRH